MTVDALEVIFEVCKTLRRSMTLQKLKGRVLETKYLFSGRFFLKSVIVVYLVKMFLAFHGTPNFVALLTATFQRCTF